MANFIAGREVNTAEHSNISVIIEAYSRQIESLNNAISTLYDARNIDACSGVMLDQIGTIVGLTRHEAGLLITNVLLAEDDDIYRLLLKYKAMMNSTLCTPEDIISACKSLFNAASVTYHEDPAIPATFYVTVIARFSETVLSLLSSHAIIVRASGVTARITCADTQFFGFSDCNSSALGFGVGKFAQSIV